MSETNPAEKNITPTSRVPGQPAADRDSGNANAVIASPPNAVEKNPNPALPEEVHKSVPPKFPWAVLPIVLLLLFVFVLFITRSRHKENQENVTAKAKGIEETQNLSNYSTFVSRNRALREGKYPEQILTDESFAGQAPLAVRANGPLISAAIDPQLAALADAFRIRVQVTKGSQLLVRGAMVTRITKGDFRGFKVTAQETVKNGIVVADELSLSTPNNGLIKTVNQVLQMVQKTDFPLIITEIQSAVLEFFQLPAPPDKNSIRIQIRPVRSWGKPIPGELLISEKSVGGISLGMPVVRMKSQLIASSTVLKRKVLVNDIYYDVYKVLDQGNDPLFYVYEKENKVWGISIISDVFKTDKGIGIGSTLDLMRINYPFIKLAYSEKKTPFVQMEGIAGIFIIQGDGEKKVISILIGDSPEFE